MRTAHLLARTLILATLLTMASVPAAVAQHGYARARVWVENDRDYFRRGERMAVRFSTAMDAYVAVIHIDTDGAVEFLFPQSHWDNNYVRGGRIYSLPRGMQTGWAVRGRPGIGYLYVIASPVPLDFDYFVGRGGWGWDGVSEGRWVRGDPFLAMDQLTRALVPDWPYTPHAADYYSYYVEGRHRYPAYACGGRYPDAGRGWGWSSYYGPCDRLDHFLREHPYYYDTRLYQGDRRTYLRRLDGDVPSHGYKEVPVRAPARGWTRDDAPPLREQRPEPVRPRGVQQASPADAERPATPVRRRPALERRPGERDGGATEAPVERAMPARGVVREPARPEAPVRSPAERPAAARTGGAPREPARPDAGAPPAGAEVPRSRRPPGGGEPIKDS